MSMLKFIDALNARPCSASGAVLCRVCTDAFACVADVFAGSPAHSRHGHDVSGSNEALPENCAFGQGAIGSCVTF